MTPGEQVRDFIPVSDVVEAFADALREMPRKGSFRVGNIGSGQPKSLRDFALEWWGRWEAKGRLLFGALPYRANEVMRYVPQCH